MKGSGDNGRGLTVKRLSLIGMLILVFLDQNLLVGCRIIGIAGIRQHEQAFEGGQMELSCYCSSKSEACFLCRNKWRLPVRVHKPLPFTNGT